MKPKPGDVLSNLFRAKPEVWGEGHYTTAAALIRIVQIAPIFVIISSMPC